MAIYQSVTENHLLPREHLGDTLYTERHNAIQQQEAQKSRAYNESVRQLQAANENMARYFNDRVCSIDDRAKFLEQVKTGFVASALTKVIKESMVSPLTSTDEAMLKNMVTQFVIEQGAGNLLTRFKHTNVYLAEMGRICREAYQATVDKMNEDVNVSLDMPPGPYEREKRPTQPQLKPMSDVLKLDSHVIDKYYSDLDETIDQGVTSTIKEKVLDAMSDFVEKNRENKLLIQEIIDQTKSKLASMPQPHAADGSTPVVGGDGVDASNPTPEMAPSVNQQTPTANNPANVPDTIGPNEQSLAQDIRSWGNMRIMEMRQNTPKGPFHYMVESLTKEVLNNDTLKSKFIKENKLDMDGIVHNAEIIYTMLEAFNTLEVVDKKYIKNYIESLVK